MAAGGPRARRLRGERGAAAGKDRAQGAAVGVSGRGGARTQTAGSRPTGARVPAARLARPHGARAGREAGAQASRSGGVTLGAQKGGPGGRGQRRLRKRRSSAEGATGAVGNEATPARSSEGRREGLRWRGLGPGMSRCPRRGSRGGGGGRGSPRLLKPPPSFPQSSWHVFCSAPCRVRGDKPGSCAGC